KINTLNNAIMELVHKKSDRNNETSRHNSAMTYLSQNINRQAKELQKAREERTVLENDLRTLESAIDSVKAGIRETDERLENIINASNELKKKHQEQTEKYLTLKSKTDVLKDIRQKDPKLRAIYSILTKNMPGIHGTVSGILKISPYHTDVVQNILGEKLNYLVCSTMNDALAAIEYLEKNNLGWATLIILENLPDIEDKTPVAHLRGEKPALSVVSYDKKWEKLLKFLLSNTYFTGNLSFSEGMVRGGSAGGTQPAEISLKEIQQVENELKNSEDELKILEGEIAASENTREELNRQSQELKLELNAKISEVKNKTEKFYITNVEIETINSEIENFKKDELENTRGLELLQSEVLAVDNSINSVQSELAQLKNSLDVLTKEESVVHQRFIESTKEFSGFESLMNSYRRELENVLLNLKNYEGQAHSSSGEIETLDKKTLEQQQIHEEETKKINACYENKSEIEKKLQEYQSENTRLSSRIEAKQGNLTCLRTEMDDLKENIHVLEIQQKTKELEMKSVTGSLQELGISFDEAKDTYLNIEVDDEQVKRLRQRILNMGNVNLAAQEEYSNLDERYNFLLNQQQDLLKAEEDLRNAINKINVSIRDDFKNTFEKVRENFKTVFSMLFEGGEADLLLTDHENLLECGIEIVVQPPGKKPQNISLSGGEKALTAIALLFAFFMVKPSPVCILDEVDAPLDTSNIVRFINLVKLYVENSQFLLITHNNRTMEAADILYGITMEEYGISKTISMRLHKQKEESPVSGRETIPGAVNA
ncbi:MAG: hypothetical protein KJ967_02635, partial [Elusimicrobia bacterium]|nr:hypothetical protein [Elusimicrobiota bacterium]